MQAALPGVRRRGRGRERGREEVEPRLEQRRHQITHRALFRAGHDAEGEEARVEHRECPAFERECVHGAVGGDDRGEFG